MTKTEVKEFMGQLSRIFDIVRLVDADVTTQYALNGQGELEREPYRCYAVRNKESRCENCIAAKAFARKDKLTKFEFVGHEVYHVVAMYLEVEGAPFVLEMVSRITDEALFGAYGKNEFAETINSYNRRLYVDPLTGAYNRRYYEDQLVALGRDRSAAIMDVDDFKRINDTYGHAVGDLALKAIVRAALSCIRSTDMVVRYGGDEFLVLFQNIPRDIFGDRLEDIRKSVRAIVLEECPELRLTVSIGGVCGAGGAQEMFRRADELLYQAKKEKNAVRWE